MLIILLLSLNAVLLQGIPVGQERVSREKRQDGVDEFNECTLPDRLDPFNKFGTKVPLVDCDDKFRRYFKAPPTTILSLKGGHPLVCCPRGSVRPPKKAPKPICEGDDIDKYYDYYDDSDYDALEELGCQPPKQEIGGREFTYNSEAECLKYPGTTCKLGNQCGAKDFNTTKPPGYCGFDQDTGADKFCCSDFNPNDKPIKEPQQPLFQKDSKAYPCLDQSSNCERWVKTNPKSCAPKYMDGYSRNSYRFMREVCQESCNKTVPNFRSNKCKKGCVDEYENCPLWSRLGFCHDKSQFMYFHCRESCGSCGFKSPLNTEVQFVDGKQYSDLSSKETLMCGSNTVKEKLDEATAEILNSQVEKDDTIGTCTNVIVSDKYAITAAHCIIDIDNERKSRTVTIRDGTKYEEVIGVRREWIHPWRSAAIRGASGGTPPVYYDIAILELERRIIYNYTEYGDSPSCIGEELDLVNQDVILQGFGIQPDETIGELLQVPLRILSNEECYESFVNESEYFARPQVKATVTSTLYDGITDQVLCSKIKCNKAGFTKDKRLNKCDAAPGDSGGPLYSMGTFNSSTGEKTGETVIGILSGGDNPSAFVHVQRGKVFLPKWYARVASFSKWIKCTQKNAFGGELSWKGVISKCDEGEVVEPFPPKCDQKFLFFSGENRKC